MKWSIRVGRVGGIEVYFHVTFVMLVAALLFFDLAAGAPLDRALAGVGSVLALFGCVFLHELGHAAAARRYGIRTRDITLLPIGGVARLERIPKEPSQELVVALAGPAVNLAIAALIFLWLRATGQETPRLTDSGFLPRLLVTNLFLFAFNLIPAFPMDGGRVLRALLASRMDYARASEIAARVGQTLAFLFGVVGLFYNPLLVFVAFFVYMGAEQEAALARVRSATEGLPVRTAMVTVFRTVGANEPLARVVELLLEGSQHDFPLIDAGGSVVGVLTRADIVAALGGRGEAPGDGRSALEKTAGEAIRKPPMPVSDDEMLEDVLLRMQAEGVTAAPVLRNGALVGLVTLENVGEFLAVQSALRRSGSSAAAALQRR